MRIVIDLQACQHAGGVKEPGLLAFAQELARHAGNHIFSIALSGNFPASLALLRAAFHDIVPRERIVVFETPKDDGSTLVQRMIALIRHNFFAGLGADLVFAPELDNSVLDHAGTSAALPAPFLTAANVAPANLDAHAGPAQADLLFAASSPIAARLRVTAPQAHVIECDTRLAAHAPIAWEAIAQLVRERPAPALPGTRASLAYVSASALKVPDAMLRLPGLASVLAQHYDVHLIGTRLPAHPDSTRLPIHAPAWLHEHARDIDRIVYELDDPRENWRLLPLMLRYPGMVVLPTLSAAQLTHAKDQAAFHSPAWRTALYCSHGYSALAGYATNDADEARAPALSGKSMLDAAMGVIVDAAQTDEPGDTQVHAGHWHGLAGLASAVDGAPGPDTGNLCAKAIEAIVRRSPAAHYKALLRAIAAIGAPADPRHPQLLAAAKAIAANQPPTMPRQLLVDVSSIVQIDMKTGISRVVRSILLSLIDSPPPGYRIEPVYADGIGLRYRYARQFTCSLLGISGLDLDDAPIEHRPGDTFLGLDLTPRTTVQQEAALADMHAHGVALYFVVYDMLPVLQPDAFPYGSGTSFRQHLDTIARRADGLVCISRAVAEEVHDWLSGQPPVRPLPLRLAYFHLGADLAASAPSTGLADNASVLLDAAARRPTLLMVGTIEPRKGHEQALAAFERLWSQGVEINLVIVGKPGWLVERVIRKLQTHPRLNRHLFWLPTASDEMLTSLYASCSALLAASTGEGFGLPLIEAARHGLPIIARDLPVFREVGGEHAYYFAGRDGDVLAHAIKAWLALFAAGQAPQSTTLPWLNWAESTRQLLAAVIGDKVYRYVAAAPA